MKAKERYDKKFPVFSFRVTEERKKIVEQFIKDTKIRDSDFTIQKYLHSLLEKDLIELGLI